MHNFRRWKFSQLATIVAALAIFGSVATIALGGGPPFFGGGGPFTPLEWFGCLDPSAIPDVRAACDEIAAKYGYQTGIVQPTLYDRNAYNGTSACAVPGELQWVCSGVGTATNSTTPVP